MDGSPNQQHPAGVVKSEVRSSVAEKPRFDLIDWLSILDGIFPATGTSPRGALSMHNLQSSCSTLDLRTEVGEVGKHRQGGTRFTQSTLHEFQIKLESLFNQPNFKPRLTAGSTR